MLKSLWQFALFILFLLFLLFAWTLIQSGQPVWAAAVLVLMAGYFVWQLIRDATSSGRARQPGPDGRKMGLHVLLGLVFIGCWLTFLLSATGLLGDHPNLPIVIVVIAFASLLAHNIVYRKRAD